MSTIAKPEYIDTWNKKMIEFLRVLMKTFPDEELFPTALAAINPIIMLSKSKVVTNFFKYASQYENEIRNKDENFFLHKDFTSEEITQHSEDGSHLLAIVGKLRGLWLVMTPDNRNAMWTWIDQLYTLSKITITGTM